MINKIALEGHALELIRFSQSAKDILAQIDSNNIYSEMTPNERLFLTELILRSKPKKVLELGVSAGGSSLILLNALSKIGSTKLISIDYLTYWYKDKTRVTGFIVDNYPDLKKKYKLYTGGTAAEFIEKIGGGIDFCLIDTQHIIPSEMIDFLLVFPFLKDNCVVVFHDTNLQIFPRWSSSNCNNMLISAISGQKLIPEHWLDLLNNSNAPESKAIGLALFESNFWHKFFNSDISGQVLFPNIAAVRLNKVQGSIWNIFNLLTQKWVYMPAKKDLNSTLKILNKYYEPFFTKMFLHIVRHQNNIWKN